MSDSFRGVIPGIIRFRGNAGKPEANWLIKKPGRDGPVGLSLQVVEVRMLREIGVR